MLKIFEAEGSYSDLGEIPSRGIALNIKIKDLKKDGDETEDKKEDLANRDLKQKKIALKIAKAKSKLNCPNNMSPHKVPGNQIRFVCKPKDKQKARKMSKIRKKIMKKNIGKKIVKKTLDTKKFRGEL